MCSLFLKEVQEGLAYLYGLHSQFFSIVNRDSGAQPAICPSAKVLPGEDVQVQVEHGLASAFPVVDHEAEGIGDAQLLRHFARGQHEVSQQVLVLIPSVHQARDTPLLGITSTCTGCLRVDVVDGDAVIVLVEELAGNLAADDLAEYGI